MLLKPNEIFVNNYKIINIIFAGIFGIVFLYSGIFSAQKNNHPIPSACVVKPCTSTGLSRGFSEMLRLNISSAKQYNKHVVSVFLFFVIQFLLRLAIVFYINKKNAKTIMFIDIPVVVVLYLYCFSGLIF